MSASIIGSITSGKSGKRFEVKWNPANCEVYVSYAGWTFIGKANSARDAMNKAEAFLYSK